MREEGSDYLISRHGLFVNHLAGVGCCRKSDERVLAHLHRISNVHHNSMEIFMWGLAVADNSDGVYDCCI